MFAKPSALFLPAGVLLAFGGTDPDSKLIGTLVLVGLFALASGLDASPRRATAARVALLAALPTLAALTHAGATVLLAMLGLPLPAALTGGWVVVAAALAAGARPSRRAGRTGAR